MIPQAYITAWRATAPWPNDAQVEQDMVLSRAVAELFKDASLTEQIALRGGTALNKLFIKPAMRYSEDIDLVQIKPSSVGPLIDSIRANLDPWLGNPKRSQSEGNFTLIYRFESEIAPIQPLRLKIEINTREHFSVLGFHPKEMAISNPWFTAKSLIQTYQLDELMGTKLRALYQRSKGRDLFDLWLCLERKLICREQVIHCFLKYMEHENHTISRAQFEQNLRGKQESTVFMNDITPLLSPRVKYNSFKAMELIQSQLISHLPGNSWQG